MRVLEPTKKLRYKLKKNYANSFRPMCATFFHSTWSDEEQEGIGNGAISESRSADSEPQVSQISTDRKIKNMSTFYWHVAEIKPLNAGEQLTLDEVIDIARSCEAILSQTKSCMAKATGSRTGAKTRPRSALAADPRILYNPEGSARTLKWSERDL